MDDWFNRNIEDTIAKIVVRIKASINGQKIDRDFRPDVHIDFEDLEENLMETPQIFAYWAMVYSEQRSEVAKIERVLKRRKSELKRQMIREAAKNEIPRVTDKTMNELIENDETVIKLEAQLILANRTAGKLYNIVEAIKMKSEHLRSLAGFKRQEHKDSNMGT